MLGALGRMRAGGFCVFQGRAPWLKTMCTLSYSRALMPLPPSLGHEKHTKNVALLLLLGFLTHEGMRRGH